MTYKQWKPFQVELILGIKCTHNYTSLHPLEVTWSLALWRMEIFDPWNVFNYISAGI